MSRYEIRRSTASVAVNGITLFNIDLSALPTDVWAVTYNDATERGEVLFTANYDDDPDTLPVDNRRINKAEWDAEFKQFVDRRTDKKNADKAAHDARIDALTTEDFEKIDPEWPTVEEKVEALYQAQAHANNAPLDALKVREQRVKDRYKSAATPAARKAARGGAGGISLDWKDPDATA